MRQRDNSFGIEPLLHRLYDETMEYLLWRADSSARFFFPEITNCLCDVTTNGKPLSFYEKTAYSSGERRAKNSAIWHDHGLTCMGLDVVLLGGTANQSCHIYAIFAYPLFTRASAFLIFFHNDHILFTEENVENHQKSRNITTISVDNYVDGVDRRLNMHMSAKNIYTSTFPALCSQLHDERRTIAKHG